MFKILRLTTSTFTDLQQFFLSICLHHVFDERQPVDHPVDEGKLRHHAGQQAGHECDQTCSGKTPPTATVSQEYFSVSSAPLKAHYEDGS